jgi:Flp pilus assembly protein TadD
MSDRGHRDLGTVAFAAGRAEEALVAFRQALALAPAPINHFNLARALIVEGQPAAARRHLAACVGDPSIGPLAAAALAALPP